jgi:hypothetical protein
VIEDDVGVGVDAVLLERLDGGEVFVLCAVLGARRALLVELAEIVKVVNGVSDAGDGVHGFLRRRHPDGSDAESLEVCGAGSKLAPEAPVGGEIPLEILKHHAAVGHGAECMG